MKKDKLFPNGFKIVCFHKIILQKNFGVKFGEQHWVKIKYVGEK